MINFLDKLPTIQPWDVFISIIILSLLSNTFIGDFLWILWMLLFVYWTIRVGEKLYEQLKNKSILSLKRFKFQIIFVITYLIIVFTFTENGYNINNNNINEYGWKAWVIIPLHIFLFYCMIHTIYFISKCIVVLRGKKEGYGWYMFGFWMFPIGIWIIQPRIIKLLKKTSNKSY